MNKKNKYTEAEYTKALEVFEYFRQLERSKVLRKKGIKYIKCQHLREGSQAFELGPQWIGETERLILCPICQNERLGVFVRYLGIDVENEEAEKKPIPLNFNQKVKRQLERMKEIYQAVRLLQRL